MPRPMPLREPTIDEMSPEGRVLHVHQALERAKADAARLPDAEGALAELIAGETLGEAVDSDAIDAAKCDVARCQQARGLVAGLERRLVQAIEAYREHETARLRERMDAHSAELRHQEAALQALQAQLAAVGAKVADAKAKADAARGVWAALPHRSHEQLLREILAKQAAAA